MTGGHPADGDLGARIRVVRQARGLSLRGLAAALSVSPATLSQIENGHTGLSVSRLSRIAEALELSVPAILDIGSVVDPIVPPPPRVPASPVRDWRVYGPLAFDPVLRAALDEFLDIGYHGATVRGIASRCGLSVAGIYHYYPSKQRMLVTIFELTMTDLLARAEAARAEGRDPVQRFALLVENLALYHTHRKELGFVGASEMRSMAGVDRERIAELRTVQQRMVDDEVAAAVRAGAFRADRPHEAARAVVTMCTALPTWWKRDGSLAPEQVAEQYVGFALELMGYRSTN